MNAFAEAFRQEIARVARKVVRQELVHLRKQVAQSRAEVSTLRKELKALAAHTKQLEKRIGKAPSPAPAADETSAAQPGTRRRVFHAETLAKKRAALGLSQGEMAALAGCASVSLYRWEHGLAKPRAAQHDALKRVMAMGKREAAAQLAELSTEK